MFMNQNRCSSSFSSSSNRDHPQEKMALHQFSTLISTCSSDQALIITMPQPHNSISESSNSTSSSHAASNDALVSNDEIIVNDQLPPSPQYSQMLMEMSRRSNTSFNSTSSCSYITQFINLGVPDSKNSIRSFQSVENGSAMLDEKAPELFNSQFNPSIVRNDLCSSRVSSNSAFEKALVPSLELKLRKLILNSSAHETTELFADAHEENLGSDRIPDTTNASSNSSNSRKRKEISRGKADLPPAVKNGIGDEKNGVKLSENSNFQRRSTTRDASNDQYVHVRARRGQATDSHSLAERVRREKINKRMKLLQDLVPGCDKITGKAVMLDEIINYVQSLQHQVQFLSMKLATVSPSLEYNVQALPSDNMLRSIHRLDCSTPIMGECLEAATSRVHMAQDDDDEVQGLVERQFGKMKIQEMKFSSQCSYGK